MVSLDGFVLDVTDSDENVKMFGRPGSSRGKCAYPQVRVVGFLENGTHVFFGAEMDRCDVGETTIARRILACHPLRERPRPRTVSRSELIQAAVVLA